MTSLRDQTMEKDPIHARSVHKKAVELNIKKKSLIPLAAQLSPRSSVVTIKHAWLSLTGL